MKILALDLGKFKSVACLYHASNGRHQFRSLRTLGPEVHDLIVELEPDVVVFETCTIAGWIHDLCQALAVNVMVANPSSEAWRWKNVKRKTDRDDALKLAQLTANKLLQTVYVPSPAGRQRRAIHRFRRKLVSRRLAIQNHIRAMLNAQSILAPPGLKAWTSEGIKQIATHAKSLDECEPEELWRGTLEMELKAFFHVSAALRDLERKLNRIAASDEQIQRLQTIPGIGPRAAEVIAACIDDPHRFKNGRQVAAYAGLVPKQFQSGTMDRQGRITKRGPGILRAMLVEVSWTMLRYNPWARDLVQRISHGQRTRRKQAIIALARRILVRCWAMLRDGTSWNPEHTPKLTSTST